jgi:hypothetical protein
MSRRLNMVITVLGWLTLCSIVDRAIRLAGNAIGAPWWLSLGASCIAGIVIGYVWSRVGRIEPTQPTAPPVVVHNHDGAAPVQRGSRATPRCPDVAPYHIVTIGMLRCECGEQLALGSPADSDWLCCDDTGNVHQRDAPATSRVCICGRPADRSS